MRHARAVMHVGIANPPWKDIRSRHSRRKGNPQYFVSGKRRIGRGVWLARYTCKHCHQLSSEDMPLRHPNLKLRGDWSLIILRPRPVLTQCMTGNHTCFSEICFVCLNATETKSYIQGWHFGIVVWSGWKIDGDYSIFHWCKSTVDLYEISKVWDGSRYISPMGSYRNRIESIKTTSIGRC